MLIHRLSEFFVGFITSNYAHYQINYYTTERNRLFCFNRFFFHLIIPLGNQNVILQLTLFFSSPSFSSVRLSFVTLLHLDKWLVDGKDANDFRNWLQIIYKFYRMECLGIWGNVVAIEDIWLPQIATFCYLRWNTNYWQTSKIHKSHLTAYL